MTAATGAFGLTFEYLRASLGDSDAFRSWVGASGDNAQTQARNRVHRESLRRAKTGEYTATELGQRRPFAIVVSESFDMTADSSSGVDQFLRSNGLWLHLEQDVPLGIENDAQELSVRWWNIIDAIVADIAALSGQAGYLAFNRITAPEEWYRASKREVRRLGDWQAIDLRLETQP